MSGICNRCGAELKDTHDLGLCECGAPAVDLRYPWEKERNAFGEIAVCQACAEKYDANQEPGDSFYEGRG